MQSWRRWPGIFYYNLIAMKNIRSVVGAILALLVVSCGGKPKKVLIMASGKITVEGNTIKVEPGTRHNEQMMIVLGNKISVNNGSITSEHSVTEPGLYLLNIKNDTLVGSYKRVGTDNTITRVTQEELQKNIDSLQQLMAGANVNTTNRNFCIAPGKLAMITANTEAQIIGPYLKMPASFEGGKDYEIYKFSTNKEIMEVVDKLKKLQ